MISQSSTQKTNLGERSYKINVVRHILQDAKNCQMAMWTVCLLIHFVTLTLRVVLGNKADRHGGIHKLRRQEFANFLPPLTLLEARV